MENNMLATTSPIQGCTSGFAMPAVTDLARTTWVVRDRKAGIAAATATSEGRVAIATVPGIHAWSPPLC